MLTFERLRELLNYEPKTGVLTWRVQRPNGVKPGDVAGSLSGDGYRRLRLDGESYLAHRVAWLYVHGKWPADQLDHEYGARGSAQVTQLREATNAQNRQNQHAVRSDNRLGIQGVYQRGGRFAAYINYPGGKRKHLGTFGTVEEASEFHDLAKVMLHPFARCAA